MAPPSVRGPVCLVCGALAGSVLGALFVPDPTGTVAFVLSLGCTAAVAGSLYRSDWLRG
ncbi:hypothetical protein [Haloplanus halophilus]|uniref:hypothetical protein n=1 Tax=Haloplanus halophilus TaxID=2949993 RepID=UPI00203CFDCC|nr:hypothetical protein [Haloplanus sp. GDY1]